MAISTRLKGVKRIQEIYEKLDRETLVAAELEELVKLSSELYEKALILRFKAAEERVFGSDDDEVVKAPIETIKTEAPVSKMGEIDFSIFDKTDEVEKEIAETPTPEIVEEIIPEPIEEMVEEEATIETAVVEPELEVVDVETPLNGGEWASYFKKTLQDHASGIQTPIHSLSGSFGLNERLLYINQLFDGEADKFSEAIQKLDKQADWNACSNELTLLAEINNWDRTDDTTGEFILHINRRYA